jgi:hypothetical protein
VKGGWRKLQIEDLHILIFFAKYNQNDEVKDVEMGRACSTNGRI